jgi:16S rRNA (guanine966-N2)-methyltransferase
VTRLIGGSAGGRRIAVPPKGTRPTTDRVRESLFNIVAARLDLTGLAVMDLYAGSGALGLEALSRGAASALFVESDRRAADVLARNVDTLGLPGASVRRATVASVLAGRAPDPFDLVLADPPYEVVNDEIRSVVDALTAHGWVHEGSLAIVERAAAGAPLNWPVQWRPWESRVYGDTRLELAERL